MRLWQTLTGKQSTNNSSSNKKSGHEAGTPVAKTPPPNQTTTSAAEKNGKVATPAAAGASTPVNPQHQYEKPQPGGGRVGSSEKASSSSSNETRKESSPTRKKERSRKSNKTVESPDPILPKDKTSARRSRDAKGGEKTVEDEKKPGSPAAGLLAKRKKMKKLSNTVDQDDNTEFERVKGKARPAASKKHATGAKNNIERLMANNNNPANGGDDDDPKLYSFEDVTEEEKTQMEQDGPSDPRVVKTDGSKSKERIQKPEAGSAAAVKTPVKSVKDESDHQQRKKSRKESREPKVVTPSRSATDTAPTQFEKVKVPDARPAVVVEKPRRMSVKEDRKPVATPSRETTNSSASAKIISVKDDDEPTTFERVRADSRPAIVIEKPRRRTSTSNEGISEGTTTASSEPLTPPPATSPAATTAKLPTPTPEASAPADQGAINETEMPMNPAYISEILKGPKIPKPEEKTPPSKSDSKSPASGSAAAAATAKDDDDDAPKSEYIRRY